VQGVGEKWLFSATSRGFGYGYEAVRIMVKVSHIFFGFLLFFSIFSW
jgi:hypothetical protein